MIIKSIRIYLWSRSVAWGLAVYTLSQRQETPQMCIWNWSWGSEKLHWSSTVPRFLIPTQHVTKRRQHGLNVGSVLADKAQIPNLGREVLDCSSERDLTTASAATFGSFFGEGKHLRQCLKERRIRLDVHLFRESTRQTPKGSYMNNGWFDAWAFLHCSRGSE